MLKILNIHHDAGPRCATRPLPALPDGMVSSCEDTGDVVGALDDDGVDILIFEFSPPRGFEPLRPLPTSKCSSSFWNDAKPPTIGGWLDAAAPVETASRPAAARPSRRLPSRGQESDHLHRPHFATGLPLRSRPTLRCERVQIIARASESHPNYRTRKNPNRSQADARSV